MEHLAWHLEETKPTRQFVHLCSFTGLTEKKIQCVAKFTMIYYHMLIGKKQTKMTIQNNKKMELKKSGN